MSLLRGAAAAAFIGGVLVACGSSRSTSLPPPATFCNLLKTSQSSAACASTEPQSCDATLTAECDSLPKGISTSAESALSSCLQSGVCGVTTCLTRAQNSAIASDAQNALAEKYCTLCAPTDATCKGSFFQAKSKLPGSIVLPYPDAVANAVLTACVSDPSSCGTFAACAQTTASSALAGIVPADLAACITTAFQNDEPTPTASLDGGPVVASCGPDNCTGCCRDDECIQGNTSDACGLNGNACQTCSKVQTCLATGECHEPCAPDNCKGCCDGDDCIPGETDDKCGMGGAACTDCPSTHAEFICSNNTCIDGSCKATCTSGCCTADGCQDGTTADLCGKGGGACVNCGAGQTCNASQMCALDQTSLWDIYIASAKVPATKADGSSWDPFGGLPDPYTKVYVSMGNNSSSAQTSTQSDTTTPTWDETPLTGISAAELINDFTFEIWDADTVDPDDLIGGCRIVLTAANFDGSLQTVTCPAGSGTVSVQLFFKLNPH